MERLSAQSNTQMIINLLQTKSQLSAGEKSSIIHLVASLQREIEIESALEMVRARTMTMRKSEELPEVAKLLFQQVHVLGLPVMSCGYNIWENEDAVCTAWMSDSSGSILPPFQIPLTESPTFIRFQESRQRGEPYYSEEVSGDVLTDHYRYMLSLPGFNEIVQKFGKAGFTLPVFQINNIINFSKGNLIFITTQNVPEALPIFQRFAKVFEQTFIRFLDLKRAEAHATEVQIQLGLERVRSRTMAMQKSQELTDVAAVLFEQVNNLGIKAWTTGFNVWSDDNKSFTDYITSPQGGFIEPYVVDVPLPVLLETRKNGDDFCVFSLEGEELKQTYLELAKFGNKNQYEKMLEDGFQFPERQFNHFVFGSKVSLMFITYEPVPEAHDIFKQFGKVFEQTYTRFLDLQKAEVFAKETLIELALEKVRTIALSMKSPDDLLITCKVIYHELFRLGFDELRNVMINIYNDDKQELLNYDYSVDSGVKLNRVPYHSHPIVSNYIDEAKRADDAFTQLVIEGEELTDWKRFRESYGEETSSKLNKASALYYYHYSFKRGVMGISNFKPIGDEQLDILKRFRNVFNLSYQRYIDIEMAEAQAREARVEAALERVRARAMAMQKSEELSDLVAILFEELTKLNLLLSRCIIWIFDPETLAARIWMANSEDKRTAECYNITPLDHPYYNAIIKGWQQRESKWVYDLQGEEKKTIDNLLLQETELCTLPEAVKNGILSSEHTTVTGAFTKFGMIEASGPLPYSDEQLEIIERFGKVFDLTYTRFNDLQQAEVQAIKAKRDLIEIKAARKKAEETLNELKATQAQLIQQEKMASLGELTAGIAHEIQNPLNFVNNFSETNRELITELKQEIDKGNFSEIIVIADNLAANEEKIVHHGRRAESIIKSMLQHSRKNNGKKELTDINSLANEYLRLAYHGMRAKEKPFQVELKTKYDNEIEPVSVMPQDIGRVLLNLYTNSFYALSEKGKRLGGIFNAELFVSTKKEDDKIEITIKDNGNGISPNVMDKIYQPFFTTKPAGQGTGLGLYLSYDIITKGHGGELKVESTEGEGTTFKILLPATVKT